MACDFALDRSRFSAAEPKIRTLHLTWMAFFVSFIVWFNHAPLMAAIQETFKLSKQEVAALLILNVALTIPARIIVGMLVDKLGPRLMYSSLLAISGVLCLAFAFAESFTTLAITRFLVGLRRRRFRGRHPHDRRVVPGQGDRPCARHLCRLRQLRLGCRRRHAAHTRALLRRTGRLALVDRRHRPHRASFTPRSTT